MSKCPNCGLDVDAGMKFCGECGTQIPQTKECPTCHEQLPLSMKFCGNCGYNFNAASSGVGSVIGDKNVIAGDVHIDQSSTVNNTTVNNVTNTTTNVVNNVVNQDDTKKLVECVVCGRQIAVVDALACKSCGKPVCALHYHSVSEKCSTCRENDVQAFKKRISELISGGVIGLQEEIELRTLASNLNISDADAILYRESVESEVENICDVHLIINGAYLHVGREPFESISKLEFNGSSNITANSPDKCYESIYAIDTVNSSISVSLDWCVGDVKRHTEQSWGEQESGLRNITFVEGEKGFGPFDDCEATLFVTETVATEDDWNAAGVTFKSKFKVYGEFRPCDVCIKYGTLSFDEDFTRIISITYKGRRLAVSSEVINREGAEIARDSWVDFKGKRLEYNAWAPHSCMLMSGEINSTAVYVAVSDFESLQNAEEKLNACGGDRLRIKELLVGMAETQDPQSCGLFLDMSGAEMTVKRKLSQGGSVKNVPMAANFSVGNTSEVFDCEDQNNPDQYVNSGSALCISPVDGEKARVTYFERAKGSIDFDFFCIGDFDPSRVTFYLQPSGAVSENGVPQMLLSTLGYTVPSYGKRFKYVCVEEDMNEEVDCFNRSVKLVSSVEKAWCVVECEGKTRIIAL